MGGSGSKQVQSNLDELIVIQRAIAEKEGIDKGRIKSNLQAKRNQNKINANTKKKEESEQTKQKLKNGLKKGFSSLKQSTSTGLKSIGKFSKKTYNKIRRKPKPTNGNKNQPALLSKDTSDVSTNGTSAGPSIETSAVSNTPNQQTAGGRKQRTKRAKTPVVKKKTTDKKPKRGTPVSKTKRGTPVSKTKRGTPVSKPKKSRK